MPPVLLALLLAAPAAAPADVEIAGRDIYPESLNLDSKGRLYVGSLPGIVYRTAPGGSTAEPWIQPDEKNGLLALLGVVPDERTNTLWVCSSPFPLRRPPAEGVSAVVAFDLTTGKLKRRYELPPPTASCNDIAIDRRGLVFVTDTPNGRIFTIRPGAAGMTLFAEEKTMVGIDGIAFAADGTLYTNNVRTNAVQRVDRKPDGSFAKFTPLSLSQKVAGPDGLRSIGGNRFVQAESGGAGGRITEVTIIGNNAAIETIWEGPESTPGVAAGKRGIFATEGKIRFLVDPKLKEADPNPFVVRAIPPRAEP